MDKWSFEPGHTAAEFRARHMMVTYVRGHFKDVHGTLEFDPENPRASSVEVKIDARHIWTGVKERDDHLRSADFLDVENHPQITFQGNQVEVKGAPSNLRKQRHQELSEKFFLPCTILETRSYNAWIKRGKFQTFEADDAIVICSYQVARYKASDVHSIEEDLVVIDEAHRLRNVYKPRML